MKDQYTDEGNSFRVVDIQFEESTMPRDSLAPYLDSELHKRFAQCMTANKGGKALAYLEGMYSEDISLGIPRLPLMWSREAREFLSTVQQEDVDIITCAIEIDVNEGMKIIDESAVRKQCCYLPSDMEDCVYDRIFENLRAIIPDEQQNMRFSGYIATEWKGNIYPYLNHPRDPRIWDI